MTKKMTPPTISSEYRTNIVRTMAVEFVSKHVCPAPGVSSLALDARRYVRLARRIGREARMTAAAKRKPRESSVSLRRNLRADCRYSVVQLVRGRASQMRTPTPTHAAPTCKCFLVINALPKHEARKQQPNGNHKHDPEPRRSRAPPA